MAAEAKTKFNNIPAGVAGKVGRGLHVTVDHPIEIVKSLIYKFFGGEYQTFDDLDPKVSVVENFDLLLIPDDHPSRRPSDTFYFDEKTVLRTHTSAHQTSLLKKGCRKFLVTGDVFRKDTIDKTHYPVFHQMEGVCVWDDKKQGEDAQKELLSVLQKLLLYLFPKCEQRFQSDYFPFTNPSFEAEIKFPSSNRWLEVLGCGVIQPQILEGCGLKGKKGWAFGLGLERLAMILFEVPDIRLFWNENNKFLSQFAHNKVDLKQEIFPKYKPYSTLQPENKDISFWVPDAYFDAKSCWVRENDLLTNIRDVADEWVQEINLVERYKHPKEPKTSLLYRVTYFPKDPAAGSAEFKLKTNEMQLLVVAALKSLNLQLR